MGGARPWRLCSPRTHLFTSADSTHPGGQPRCRIHSLWPKRDGSLTELLRRTYTSISPGTPRIKLALL